MKAKGITGKGCYKEYWFVPKWFSKVFSGIGNGSLLNVSEASHYIGFGFDPKKKVWDNGVFLTTFEMCLPYWRQKTAEADFIIHFWGEV